MSEVAQRIASCQDCTLARGRTRAVPGEGPERADILFIGEGPGWHEDQQGRPFVGPAGKYLEELLASVGLRREEVYITNIIKCRTPGNRDPLPPEVQACGKYLERQIELIGPRMIVTLGRYSMARFFPGEGISKVHGTWRKRDGRVLFAMYHPAAALHQQSLKRTIEADMLKIPQALAQVENMAPEEPQPEQLSLF
ncbi:MAG: uracil-DNA glycosylase [Dehalococcoidia bacterium]